MKAKIFNVLVFFLLTALFTSCGNDDDEGNQNSSLEGQGQSLMAFTAFGDINCGEITVTVDGLGTKTMNGENLPMGFVQCQDIGPMVLQWDDIPDGVYTYVASCTGYTWTSSRTIGIGSCSYLALTAGSAD